MLDNPVVAYCVLLRWWEKNCLFHSYNSAGATAHSEAYFGEGSGPVNLDFVQCSGSEYILTDCELENTGIRSSHALDVGVKCQPGRDTLSICASFFCSKYSDLYLHIQKC